MEFTFEQKPWELRLSAMHAGDVLDAAVLLAMLRGEAEEEVDEALEMMNARGITLNVDSLPVDNGGGQQALRLKREKDLADKGQIPDALEENDPLRLYFQEVAGVPAAGDPQLMAQRIAEGEANLEEPLVNLMLGRVIHKAMALAGKGVLLLDLIQEGNLGLWQSVVNFSQGNFEEQCLWWISQYQAQAVFRQALAGGTGEKLRKELEDYRQADRQLLTKLGRNPLPEEIAEFMGISGEDGMFLEKLLREVRQQQKVHQQEVQEEIPEEEDQSVENTAYYQSRQRIRDMLSGLDDADAELIGMRYGLEGGLPLDPAEVGRRLGLTPEEVLAKEAAALEKLRQQSE